jgi:3'-phosphoadenosine 5'-phosphosulfate sulfotransferase (PAPS reductase)/FAD synthetase
MAEEDNRTPAAPPANDPEGDGLAILAGAVERFRPVRVFALFSGGHSLVYGRLKERCLRQLVREHKAARGDRVLLVSGIRRQESRRRMGYVEPVQADGARVWAAPLLNWSHDDKYAYLDAHALDRNPVVERLCMSGECLCGAFARKGELDEIAFWYPDVAARIRALEARAAAAGVPCRWGQAPAAGERTATSPVAGLCWSCGAKKATEGDG